MTVFVGTYLLLTRRQLRFPRALLLLPLGLVAAWVAERRPPRLARPRRSVGLRGGGGGRLSRQGGVALLLRACPRPRPARRAHALLRFHADGGQSRSSVGGLPAALPDARCGRAADRAPHPGSRPALRRAHPRRGRRAGRLPSFLPRARPSSKRRTCQPSVVRSEVAAGWTSHPGLSPSRTDAARRINHREPGSFERRMANSMPSDGYEVAIMTSMVQVRTLGGRDRRPRPRPAACLAPEAVLDSNTGGEHARYRDGQPASGHPA